MIALLPTWDSDDGRCGSAPGFRGFHYKNLRKSGFRVADPAIVATLLAMQRMCHTTSKASRIVVGMNCFPPVEQENDTHRRRLQKALVRAVMELDPIYTGTWTKLTTIQQNTCEPSYARMAKVCHPLRLSERLVRHRPRCIAHSKA